MLLVVCATPILIAASRFPDDALYCSEGVWRLLTIGSGPLGFGETHTHTQHKKHHLITFICGESSHYGMPYPTMLSLHPVYLCLNVSLEL